MGAGAFGFHPTLEWIFVGDRGGTLLAWDVSTERPSMIGMWVSLYISCYCPLFLPFPIQVATLISVLIKWAYNGYWNDAYLSWCLYFWWFQILILFFIDVTISVYFPTDLYLSLLFSTQAGSQPITSVSWLPTLRLLITIAKDGALQVWKTRVIINPNRQPMETHFFERAGWFFFFSSLGEIEKSISYFFSSSQAAFHYLHLHSLFTCLLENDFLQPFSFSMVQLLKQWISQRY